MRHAQARAGSDRSDDEHDQYADAGPPCRGGHVEAQDDAGQEEAGKGQDDVEDDPDDRVDEHAGAEHEQLDAVDQHHDLDAGRYADRGHD